jgi:hypothetical protein
MSILAAIPVINCRTIEQTLTFYLQLLQYVVVDKRETRGCLQWVHLKHGNTSLMLKRIETASAQRHDQCAAGVSLYLYVDNIRQLHHYIKARNWPLSDIVLQDYAMVEFSIMDPEGNPVTVGQSRSVQE